MNLRLICFLSTGLSFSLSFLAHSQTYSYGNLAGRMTNLEYLATLPAPGDKCALWSSYDRISYYDPATGDYVNWDANNDCCGIMGMDGTNEILAAMRGPGCIWRIWSATPGAGHVRIYLDGTNTPTVDLPFSAYFDGQHAPFTNHAIVHSTAANGWNNYTPIPYQTSCLILADTNWGSYYQFTYETFPTNVQVPTFNLALSAADAAVLSSVNAVLSNSGADPAGNRAGQQTLTNLFSIGANSTQLVAQLTGPAAITRLRVLLNPAPASTNYDLLRELALQINWDGETNASVWAPLGDFFGTAPGPNQYLSLPLGYASNGWWYCYWYMPFATNARVQLINEGTNQQQLTFQITTAPLDLPIGQLTRFHAKWHRDAFLPTEPGRDIDWTVATNMGTGRFVGTMLHIWNPLGGWWGEGDEKFFVDAEVFPSSFGTGSEDYFGYAWSSPVLFQHAYHDQTHNDGNSVGHISANRWHISDNVPFQTSIQACIEKYFPNSRPALYAAMGYWYLAPGGIDPYLPVALSKRVDYWTNVTIFTVPGAIEGEDLAVAGITGGSTQVQNMLGFAGQWSGEAQLWWTGGLPGNTLDLALPVSYPGLYDVSLQLTEAPDYAIVQLYLDGQALGHPIDLFSLTVIPSGQLDFGHWALTAGQHDLRVQIVGKDSNAIPNYMFGLDYVLLTLPGPPTPILATADSYSTSSQTNTINVWFNKPPAATPATTLTNYTLNHAPGVSLTSAALLGQSGLGVVLGVTGPIPINSTLSVSGVQDAAGLSGSFQVPIQVRLVPVNAVATCFHGNAIAGGTSSQMRAAGFAVINDDLVNNSNNGPNAGGPTGYTGFDTFDQATTESQFVGLLYGTAVDIRALKVDLGQQFGDGGSWNSVPTVYILKNPADTAFTRPETDPADWMPVAAQLVSGSQFCPAVGPNPSSATPIVFSLTNLDASVRTGYGWAVGGVPGDGVTGFVSVSELRAYGVVQAGPRYAEGPQTNFATVSEGGRATLAANVTSTYPLAYQWLENGTNISGATNSTYSIPPAGVGNNGEVLSVAVSGGGLSITSTVATLNVNAQTNPPMLTAAAYNPVAQTLDLYFNDAVSPGTAGKVGSYVLNDPNLSITGVTVDVKGYLVTLTVSGTQITPFLTVTLTNVTDLFGNTNSSQTMPALPLSWPASNVVADAFQQGRATSLSLATNGIVSQEIGGQAWETFFAPPIPFSFVGLTYGQAQIFKLIKLDLGGTFFDGGDFAQQPQVYILKNPVDTDMIQPQTDPTDWTPVPARLITGNVFQPETDGPPGSLTTNSPITYDLTGLPLNERTGCGWAVAGPANGLNQFLSISELSSFQVAPLPPVELSVVLSAGETVLSWPQAATGYALESSPVTGPPAVWTPVNAVPQVTNGQNMVTLPASGYKAFYRLAQ